MLNSYNTVISTINFNSDFYTIKLIDSLLKASLNNCIIIISDNNSNDDSYLNIDLHLQQKEWLSNKQLHVDNNQISTASHFQANNEVEFILLQLCENYGFAKANNIAFRYVNNLVTFDYFWLLNNDTTILDSSLPALSSYAKKYNNNILLSSLIYKDVDCKKIWFSGGFYNKYFAIAGHNYAKFKTSKYKFLSGCSLFIPVEVIDKIGLLNEDIFLYAEDLEFSIRATAGGIPMDVVDSSIIFHVGGGSSIKRSYISYYNITRYTISVIVNQHNRLLYITIIPYHILKIMYLFLFQSVPFSALRGYIKGINDAIFKGHKVK